jgi:hypothetical protein
MTAAPALDGLRSVVAFGNRVIGPVDVGVIGADAKPIGPIAKVCEIEG